jgi:hypothetical protein
MRPASVLGSMLLVAVVFELLTTTHTVQGAEISVGDDRLGVYTAPILLLSRADVQSDLKLSQQQATEARQITLTLRERAASAKEEALRRQIEHDMTTWLKLHLSPEQFDRLHQVDLQWEGVAAIARRPIIAEYIRLTDPQKTSLRAAIAEHLRTRGAQPPTIETHLALNRQGLSTLSPEQQAQWQRLLGAPCHFAVSARTPPQAATAAAPVSPARQPR